MKDDGPPWLKRIGIDRTCRLVAMCRGMVVLTAVEDGTHTLWLYDWPVAVGGAAMVRREYAKLLALDPRGAWLVKFYT